MRFKSIPTKLLCMVVVSGLMILHGCAGFGRRLESPEISLANISLQEAKAFETTFELDLRVFNTNDVPLEIKGIECELEVNGNKLAKGVSATQTTVPAFGTELVRMVVYSSMLGMVSSMLDMIRSAQSNQITRKLNYKISGRLSIGGDSTIPWRFPFTSQGELDMEGISTGKTSP
ncbi:MAG: LEA type 2 family protein [Desulfobacterales bacterium]